MFIDIELNGMYIDTDVLYETQQIIQKNAEEAATEVYRLMGESLPRFIKTYIYGITKDEEEDDEDDDFWFNLDNLKAESSKKLDVVDIKSPTQLSKYFEKNNWEKLAGKDEKKQNTYTVDETTLTKYYKLDPEKYALAKPLLKFKEMNKLLSSYSGNKKENTGLWKDIKYHKDGSTRIHSNFSPMLTVSGRGKCSDPNLQQVPKKGEMAKLFRRAFIPPSKDYYLAEWDAAGLQLRIAAILSGDAEMINAFVNLSGDLHSKTAQSVFMRDISLDEFMAHKKEEPYSSYRFKAKGINFGFIFGQRATSFAKTVLAVEWTYQEIVDYIETNDLKSDVEYLKENREHESSFTDKDIEYYVVAKDIRNKWFKEYPGIEQWIEQMHHIVEKQGFVRSVFGAFRRLVHIQDVALSKKYNLISNKFLFLRTKINNLLNKAVNSPVQNYEAVLMMLAMIKNQNVDFKERGLKSYIVGNVHDSCVLYIHKSELEIVFKLIKKAFEADIPENKGIPMLAELEICDYYNEKTQYRYWGSGLEVDEEKVKFLTDHYNKYGESGIEKYNTKEIA
jgi:DNA polymerase I-like protein with 3'-5' exonuclease and polymerase domains